MWMKIHAKQKENKKIKQHKHESHLTLKKIENGFLKACHYSSRWVRDFLVFGLGTTVTHTSTLNGGDLLNVGGNCSSLKFN